MRRRSASLTLRRVARMRSARLFRWSWKVPRRDRPQMWVNPRKQNVSGLPSPRWARRSAAKRPNSIRRVLSGCSVSANSSKRAHIASRKRRASASCSNPTTSRVAEGTCTWTCTPPPSQTRTGDPRLIRLLHSSLRPHALPPQDEQVGIAACDAPQPVHRRTFPAPEPRVLPLCPFPESLIQVTEHLNAPRAIEPPVVVQPAPHHRVHKASQILQALVIPGGRHPPAADGLPDRRRGLGADRRQEADEVSPPPVLRPSRLEGVAEEVERDVFILTRPVVVLASTSEFEPVNSADTDRRG